MKKQFVKLLLKLVSDETGCRIQYGNCSCNTCFHTWAEETLGLSQNFAHLFWLLILSLRGDCKESELILGNESMFVELSQGILKSKKKKSKIK